MNFLPTGFYLPVPVTEDLSKKIFFLSPHHESSIKKSYALFDEIKKIESVLKVSYFMTGSDVHMKTLEEGEIRALKSCPRDEEALISNKAYDHWLEDKVILRSERFFPGRPVWNIGSTRHALLGNYQFKGVGFTGITGRCDYPHITGSLDIYQALYETVMSWHLASSPLKTQKVVALWKDDDKKNPKILMLREANSFRVAQLIGIDFEDSEKQIIFRSLNVTSARDLPEKFLQIVRNYAWLVAHSYEYTSPTFDNLMIDGSLIDCSSLLHHDEAGFCVPIHVSETPNGEWQLIYHFYQQVQTFVDYTYRAYIKLGMDLNIEDAYGEFWKALSSHVGDHSQKLRSFQQVLLSASAMGLVDWKKHLENHFPEAVISSFYPEQSRFSTSEIEKNRMCFLINFKSGPTKEFRPYQVTDRILKMFHADQNPDPKQFAEAIIRAVAL